MREMNLKLTGVTLAILGTIYLIKPNLYRRWFWKKTSIAQRLLKPEHYVIYMRILGGIVVLVGLFLFF